MSLDTLDTYRCYRKLLKFTNIDNNFENMNEVTGVNKYHIPQVVGKDLVLVDRNLLVTLISEIEDKLDELETITDPEFIKEVSLRFSDIESGKVEGLDENRIFELLER